MKKKLGWIILVIAMIAFIGGASVLYNKYSKEIEHQNLVTDDSVSAEDSQVTEEPTEEQEEESTEEELVMAPDFKVYDAEGNAVNLSDYFGKPIILNFWASWCGPCQMEMPDFEEAYKEYGEEVQFLMVNSTAGSRETLETAQKFIEDNGYSFPVLFDTEANAAMAYGVNSLPNTYFIDGEGHAIGRVRGIINMDTLVYGVQMLTGQLEEN
jgi:thiol-disulfide isomerase/thioredoxin